MCESFCNYGGIVGEESDTLAMEALIFLLVALKSGHHYHIAYWLVENILSGVSVQLVRTALCLRAELTDT